MAKKIDPDDWIRLQTAANRRGVSRQAIENLVNRGKLETVLIDQLQFVKIADVDNYTPDNRGRPRKEQDHKTSKVKARTSQTGLKIKSNASDKLNPNFKVDKSATARALSKAYAITQKRIIGEK